MSATTRIPVDWKSPSKEVRLSSEDYRDVHGHDRGTKSSWPGPKLVAASEESSRADQGNHIKANEFLDDPDVLEQKMQVVADLIRKSKFCIAYTGAGLSKASGIPDYATKASNSIVKAPKITSSLDAQPTYAHRVLASMEKKGFLKYYVQQNHDGLPQKAGYPQEKINEIHGAWFDPSNPVVQFSGSLRSDLFKDMCQKELMADLCLCLGTSLSGMNADRMAKRPAKRMMSGDKSCLGTIIINLQQTPLDDMCAVRVWAKLDDAFDILCRILDLNADPIPIVLPDTGDVFEVAYNSQGQRDDNCRMTLDLRQNAKVRIAVPEAVNSGVEGRVVGKRDGSWSIELNENKGKVRRLLGPWWVVSALNKTIDQLPVVNANPE